MNSIRQLILSGSLLCGLTACGEQVCGTLPACINPSPTEVQPSGGVIGGVTMGAGQSQDVTFTVSRTDLPPDDAVSFVPYLAGPSSDDATLLGRSAEGIEIHGSQQPFTTETVHLTVVTPTGLPRGGYSLGLRLKRAASRYASTTGSGALYVTVP